MLNINIKNGKRINLSIDFIEWFRGFTDAEGCFQVTMQSLGNGKYFEFRYSIGLHIDDKAALYYIQDNLQIGKVRENVQENIVTYNIIAKEEIEIIIQLFSLFNLNSSRHLNFLSFKEAFLLYINWNNLDYSELTIKLMKIQARMNSNRIDFTMPENHKIYISPFWLLGFIEGDGCFSFKKPNKNAVFTIGQKGNKNLLLAIKDYLQKIAINDFNLFENKLALKKNWININIYKDVYNLNTNNVFYIQYVLIPLLDNLKWHTKKYLDYSDWKYIIAILSKGLHYLPEGIQLIMEIVNQMNNYRLSTSEPKVKNILCKSKVEEFLNQPSNYEIRKNRLFIISLNRYKVNNVSISLQLINIETKEILKSFSSLLKCANYLGITRSTLKNRIIKSKSFLLNGKKVLVSLNNSNI